MNSSENPADYAEGGRPQKLVIRGDMRFAAEAFALLQAEAGDFAKYNKIGWGWSFGPWLGDGSRFFVRRLKDGLSCSIRTSINDPRPLAHGVSQDAPVDAATGGQGPTEGTNSTHPLPGTGGTP